MPVSQPECYVRRTTGARWLPWLGIVLAAILALPVAAQDVHGISIEGIQHAIDSLKSNEQLDPTVRKQALERYRQALSALQAAADRRSRIAALNRKKAHAPRTLAQLKEDLAEVGTALTRQAVADMTTQQLSERLDKLESRVAELQTQLANLNSRLTDIAQRPAEVRDELAAARAQLRSLETVSADTGQQPDVLGDAEAALTAARRAALNAKIDLLEQELATLDTREQILEARRALTRRKLERYSRSLAVVRAVYSERQKNRARRLYEDVKARAGELTDAADVVAKAAARNAELAAKLARIARRSEALAATRARLRDRLEDLESRFNLVQRQLQIGGASAALADVLRAQKRKLADAQAAALEILQQLPNLAAFELRAFQLQQAGMRLEDAREVASELIAGSGGGVSEQARSKLVELLQRRRDIIARLVAARDRFVGIGRDLQSMSRRYQQTITEFRTLLEERLFWLPTFAPVDWQWVPRLVSAIPAYFQPQRWGAVLRALGRGIWQWPLLTGAGLLLFLLLRGGRAMLRNELRRAADPVGNVSRDTFWVTLRAAGATVLLCLPWALLLALAGWLLMNAPQASAFAAAVGTGLVQLAGVVLFITPFREVCRPFGLAQAHFRWPDAGRRRLRRSLRYLLIALAVPVFFVTIPEVLDNDVLRSTVGRLTFVFGSLTMAWFAWHVLHPRRGVFSEVFGPQQHGRWLLGYFWMPLTVGISVALAVLAAWGYYYTALQLESRYFYSAGVGGASIIVYSLIIRWVTVVERRLALARALRKREEAREARATREAAAVAGEGTPDSLDTVEIDMIQISEQTRSLIRAAVTLLAGVGLWFLWADLLPALSQFNEIRLWQYVVTVDGDNQIHEVTLGALLLALLVGVFTALAGRNLPGFLEITVLRQFSRNPGSRYAIAKLVQYAIVTVGLLVAITMLGVSWTSIQWLVAAIGVGLGFGLQEIFANFVSGLVILFERPVRVGDTVSVGTLTGTVSRIRIRATTITDWDNKEVIIPNKTFVTETVVNWTLTDAITRLIVRVSIARDADNDLAQRLISEAIDAEPSALDEPAPSVFIVGFEEGQTVFEARVFFHDLYYLLPLQHALYQRIKEAFDQHDIEISFPQKDLHLRSVDGSVRDMFAAGTGRAPGTAADS